MSLITITRCIGCGGEEIARKVAGELGLPLYNDKKLEEEAVHMGCAIR